ncbi:MAG: ChaN family lipoprotein [Magnetococcales bacterium]|nr:ChaN family lipoprotein [Magnetococcales bacterium]
MFLLPFMLGLALFQWSVMGPIAIAENEIVRLSDQTVITREAMIDRLASHRVVLVGETHDHPDHHRIQLAVIQGLHARGVEMAVSLEMFPDHLQPHLDRWVAGELSEAAFLDAVEWYFTWGFDINLYWPILRYAKEQRIPLLAMNLRRETVSAVRKRGLAGVEMEIRDALPPLCPAPLAYRLRLEEVFNAHPMMSHGGHFDHFVEAQGVWDGVMADRIKKWSDAHPQGLVVGLVGAGHVYMGHGIPHQLRGRGVTGVAILLPWSGEEAMLDRDAADFAWGTPPAPDTPPPTQLGITMDDQQKEGVRVQSVLDDSLAAKAGLRPRDRITRFNAHPLPTRHALVRLVRSLSPGEGVVLQVEREGKEEEIRIPMP